MSEPFDLASFETVGGFRGEYDFLSNFYRLETPYVDDYGFTYITNEHFYQASKFPQHSEQRRVISEMQYGCGLKSYVRRNKNSIISEWNDVKESVMMEGLLFKFSEFNPILRTKLVATGDIKLVAYNWWGDTYWGVCDKKLVGKNRLGILLMEVRQSITGVQCDHFLP